MKLTSLTGLAAGLLFFAAAKHAAGAEFYARVCLTVSVAGPAAEVPLDEQASPGVGKKLRLHLEANTDCVAIVVPMSEKDDRPANDWRPQLVDLGQWEEKLLPLAPETWDWTEKDEAFAFQIIFMKSDAADLPSLRKLVAAMQNRSLESRVLTLQTAKLHELLAGRLNGENRRQEFLSRNAKTETVAVGGVTRTGAEFEWREHATRVDLDAEADGAVVLRYGTAK